MGDILGAPVESKSIIIQTMHQKSSAVIILHLTWQPFALRL